jgi:hypothetical protein
MPKDEIKIEIKNFDKIIEKDVFSLVEEKKFLCIFCF